MPFLEGNWVKLKANSGILGDIIPKRCGVGSVIWPAKPGCKPGLAVQTPSMPDCVQS